MVEKRDSFEDESMYYKQVAGLNDIQIKRFIHNIIIIVCYNFNALNATARLDVILIL